MRVAVWSALASGVGSASPAADEGEARPGRASGAALWLAQPQEPAQFARELYDTLRRIDTLGVQRLLVQRVPATPEWDAVRDRLARAAATFEE
jgi:L-threonylcarbamoyladenylate synthase